MKYNLDIESLRHVYLISNTVPFLIDNFKNDNGIQYLRDYETIENLIEEFITISNSDIDSVDGIVYAYAVYIAILLKRSETVESFLETEGNIKYEWFPEIKKIYFEKLRPTTTTYIPLNTNFINKSNNIKFTSTDSESEDIEITC